MFMDINGKDLYPGDEVMLSPLYTTDRLTLPVHIGIIRYEGNKAWVGDTEVFIYDILTLNKRNTDGNTA